jgi:hypothetical protein
VNDFVEEFRYAVNSGSGNDAGSDNSLVETIILGVVPTFEEEETEQFAGELTLVGYNPEPEEPEVDLNKTIVVAKPRQPDFEMTLVPGMLPVVNDLPVQPAETEVMSEEFTDDSLFDSANDDTPVPRSIPPVILAAGVLLFITLIAIGIYYSRTAQ